MTFLIRLWSFLVEGDRDPVLRPSWFDNRDRLAGYQAFTDRQLHSCVTKNVAATNRERFWLAREDKRIAQVVPFRKVAR